jgi:hypothetical protein
MSALTTHTFGNQRKGKKEKKQIKRNSNKRSKAEKRQRARSLEEDKSQTPLARATARHIRDKTMLKQRAQTTKTNKSSPCTYANSPLNKCQPWAQTGQAGSHNQSDRFHQNRSGRFRTADHTPQKPKMQMKCTRSPLTLGIGSRDAMQLFSTFLSPPCCQCMNQGSNLKICNLELLNYTKFITRCYTCPNEQVRYSTAS